MAEKKSGWLQKAFWGAAKLVTVGVVAAVAWQVLLDPSFLPVFHDALNQNAQAWASLVRENFGEPITNFLGFTGDGGLLNTEFAQNILEPYMKKAPVPTTQDIVTAFNAPQPSIFAPDALADAGADDVFTGGGLSLDSLG